MRTRVSAGLRVALRLASGGLWHALLWYALLLRATQLLAAAWWLSTELLLRTNLRLAPLGPHHARALRPMLVLTLPLGLRLSLPQGLTGDGTADHRGLFVLHRRDMHATVQQQSIFQAF